LINKVGFQYDGGGVWMMIYLILT